MEKTKNLQSVIKMINFAIEEQKILLAKKLKLFCNVNIAKPESLSFYDLLCRKEVDGAFLERFFSQHPSSADSIDMLTWHRLCQLNPLIESLQNLVQAFAKFFEGEIGPFGMSTAFGIDPDGERYPVNLVYKSFWRCDPSFGVMELQIGQDDPLPLSDIYYLLEGSSYKLVVCCRMVDEKELGKNPGPIWHDALLPDNIAGRAYNMLEEFKADIYDNIRAANKEIKYSPLSKTSFSTIFHEERLPVGFWEEAVQSILPNYLKNGQAEKFYVSSHPIVIGIIQYLRNVCEIVADPQDRLQIECEGMLNNKRIKFNVLWLQQPLKQDPQWCVQDIYCNENSINLKEVPYINYGEKTLSTIHFVSDEEMQEMLKEDKA